MSRTAYAVALVTLVAAGVGQAHAQSQTALVGKWTIDYERGRRIENGEVTPIMGRGELTVVQSGDSLVATLVGSPLPDGTVSTPSTFGGHAKGDDVVFVQHKTAKVETNGEASTLNITLTWTLRAAGDALTGSLASELPGMPEPMDPSPVKGTRAHQ